MRGADRLRCRPPRGGGAAGPDGGVFGLGGVGPVGAPVGPDRRARPGSSRSTSATTRKTLARAQGATDFLVAGDAKELSRAIRGSHRRSRRRPRLRMCRAAPRPSVPPGRRLVAAAPPPSSGIGPATDKVEFSALELFHFARTLRGCVYGNGDPAVDLPVLADHVRTGALDLSALVTDRIGLDDVPAAFERMASGRGGRSLVVFCSRVGLRTTRTAPSPYAS